jgi:cell division protein FtsN
MHKQHYNRQQGGTFIGIIIGLVIGLGIALAVAMAITKTPMPFTNKFIKPEKSGAPATSQNVDPNRSMYNKAARDGARPAARESNPPPNQVVEKPVENKAPIVEAPPARSDEVKAAAAKPESTEDKWSYFLQAGAFRERTDAENTRAKLALLGVEARVTERQSENGTLYRVRIGPFAQLDAMNRVRGKLSDNGVDAAVVRISK